MVTIQQLPKNDPECFFMLLKREGGGNLALVTGQTPWICQLREGNVQIFRLLVVEPILCCVQRLRGAAVRFAIVSKTSGKRKKLINLRCSQSCNPAIACSCQFMYIRSSITYAAAQPEMQVLAAGRFYWQPRLLPPDSDHQGSHRFCLVGGLPPLPKKVYRVRWSSLCPIDDGGAVREDIPHFRHYRTALVDLVVPA